MADCYLRIVPVGRTHAPSPHAGDIARKAFELMIAAEVVTATASRDPFFVDSGTDLREVRCPLCSQPIALEEWRKLLDAAKAWRFRDLGVTLPCCGGHASLDELHYDAPCTFARFMLEARNPARTALTTAELATLGRIVGQGVRTIIARL